MGLETDLAAIAGAARRLAGPGEEVTGVIATEPEAGRRVYLCAFEGAGRSWVALDDDARPVADRSLVRGAVAIAALCELAEESAVGGKLDELRARLRSLRETEQPEGIEEAEEAALALEQALGSPPRLATPERLDAVGAAARRLERALSDDPGSPFVEAMKNGSAVVDELEREILGTYRGDLD
jgi:hypothetical protein